MTATMKEEVVQLIRRLPDQVAWDDIMYEIYVRQKIAKGMRDVGEGKVVTQEEVEQLFLGQ